MTGSPTGSINSEPEEQVPERTWRDSWLVINWLTATPFFGGFFKTSDMKEAANHLGGYMFMVAGGTVLMIKQALPTTMDQPLYERYTKMVANMVIGMAAGQMCYNTLFSAGKAIISRLPCSHDRNQERRGNLEAPLYSVTTTTYNTNG